MVGVGESAYYRHGKAPEPEFKLLLRAILAACEDAGISPKSVDGFCSYAGDRNDPIRLSTALGVDELRLSNMHWGAGGGGSCGGIGVASAFLATGMAECVVVYRALAQGQFGRFGRARGGGGGTRAVSGWGVGGAAFAPFGVFAPGQIYAPKMTRLVEERGVDPATFEAVSLACYHHAQNNPRAQMSGRPLDPAAYEGARRITEPMRLYDYCQESDGAAAMVLVAAERAKDLRADPVYVLGVAQGAAFRQGAGYNDPDYATAGFTTVARRLYEVAGLGPADVDVAQIYENFTPGVVMSLIEHGFCGYEDAAGFLTYENLIAPSGRLPLNTSGGNLAEAYIHGMGLNVEAVRQLRGESCNPVPGAKTCLVAGGPMVEVVTNALFGTEEALG